MVKKRGYDSKKILLSLTGLVILFVILILGNVLLSFANIRYDATEEKIYSLSKGTENIISALDDKITVKFFFSRSNPDFPANLKLYAKRVRDFLSEYENSSGGRIDVEIYDPKADSDEEEWALKYGVKPMQLASGEKIFCGLVFLSLEQEQTIGLLDPAREPLLEYDITRIINDLRTFKKKKIGIISTLPVFGQQGYQMPGQPGSEAWYFVTELKKTYELSNIPISSEKLDNSLDLLIVIHPKALSEKLLYAVDQYVVSGGNAIIFVDPACVSASTRGPGGMVRPSSSSMDRLFTAWGISMDSTKAVVDFDQPTRLRTRDNLIENNPAWISVRQGAFNESDVVTSGLERVLLPVAGAIKKTEGSSCEFEHLLQSGTNAGLVDPFTANAEVRDIKKAVVPSEKPLNLAVRVRDIFKTAFPEGLPESKKESDKKDQNSSHIDKGTKKSTIIVIADVDMLADGYYISKGSFLGFPVSEVFNDNLNLLSNASEMLTGSEDLIGLRSRGSFERPFSVVLELERRAQERWMSKEKELVKRAEETNRLLNELQQRKDESQKLIISPEQEAEIAKFREQKRAIDKELKEVRKKLREDIEALGAMLKAVNIFLMPLIISICGIGFAVYRQRRIKKK